MKISELLEELKEIKKLHGDLEVKTFTSDGLTDSAFLGLVTNAGTDKGEYVIIEDVGGK